jgi:hypothetical protein
MIEFKANSREINYTNLIMNWKWYTKDIKNINYSFRFDDVDVLVVGGTKWLKLQATIQMANQDAYNNPNDANQEDVSEVA